MHTLFAEAYEVRPDERRTFGTNWIGPTNVAYPYQERTLIAVYLPQSSDGRAVNVFCTAMPARFYELQVIRKHDKPGYAISTGTIDARYVHGLALAIAEGMLGWSADTID